MGVIEHPMAILAVFFCILGLLFHLAAHPVAGKLFKVLPVIAFVYFIPMGLTTAGVLPDSSPLYKWIKTFLLPFALFVFTLSLDLPTILKLGWKIIVMMLVGTFGILIGGPIALFFFKNFLPADAWQGLAALAGSWIGGGANFVAISQAVNAPDSLLGPIIVIDVAVGYTWMGFLMYFAARYEGINRWLKADRSAVDHVQKKMEDFQASVSRVTSFNDLLVILGLGFVFTSISYWLGNTLPPVGDFISGSTWRVIAITTFGVACSFTKLRNYEGAGASKMGSVALYLLIATIGAGANMRGIIEYPVFVLCGVLWISIHIGLMILTAKLIRAPFFFLAIGSQANVGGAASAPVLAAAFHPALAPVGVLLGILGYVLGTYAGLLCAFLLRLVALS